MPDNLLCSIADAAKALAIGRTKTISMINSKELESIKIGSRRLVKMESIKSYIDRAAGGEA
jgi:excisionase family DNA binding protein